MSIPTTVASGATRPGIGAVPETEADELTLVRTTYARDLTNEEFGVLVADARHRGLSVVKREVVGIKFQGRMTPYVTLAGARTLAEQSGKLAGVQGPFFCGADGLWVEVWLAVAPPAAAKFIVHRHDQIFPVVGIATWRERNQPNSPTWKGMPSLMLGKTAEIDAYRRARLIADDCPVHVDGGDGCVRPKAGAMRHLHGVGTERGIDHGELRNVVAAIRPGTASMTDQAIGARDLGAAADLIEALDDDAVGLIVAEPERMAEPADAVVASEDDGSEVRYGGDDSGYPGGVTPDADPRLIGQWLDHIERAATMRNFLAIEKGLQNAGLDGQRDLASALAIKRGELESV